MAVTCTVASFVKYFPLRNPSEETIGQLYQCLWDWKDCLDCKNRGDCTTGACQWALQPSLRSFGSFYQSATFRYTSDDWSSSLPLLQSHGALQQLIRFIVDRPDLPREILMSEYFSSNGYAQATDSDKDRAMNLAYSIIAMLPCAGKNRFYVQYRLLPPVIWKRNQAACEVWENAMPTGKTLTHEEAQSVTISLSAKRLQDCGFKIIDTRDPRLHLVYDSTTAARRVYVFHQAGFLTEHLSYQVRQGPATKHVVPRRIALELLYTLRHVLYKWDDGASRQIAMKAGFGIVGLGLDICDYSYDDEYESQYHHWGARLLALTEIVNQPGSDCWIWRRLLGTWRCRTEHVTMLLALLALIVAVVSGVIGPWMQSQEQKEDVVSIINHILNGSWSGD